MSTNNNFHERRTREHEEVRQVLVELFADLANEQDKRIIILRAFNAGITYTAEMFVTIGVTA